MVTFKPDKKARRRRQWEDYKKKSNILKSWQRENENRKKAGLLLKNMPVDFPDRRKWKRNTK